MLRNLFGMIERMPLRILPSWRPGRYLQASGMLFFWLVVRALAQATMVVALSHLIGAGGYGRFVSILAVASFLTPFAGLGLQGVLLRDGAREPAELGSLLQQAMKVWVWSTTACCMLGPALAWLMLPRDLPWKVVPFVVAVELATASLVELLARAQQCQHRLGRYGAITAGLPLARLATLMVYAATMRPTLSGWLWVYTAGSLAYSGMLLAVHGPFSSRPRALKMQIGEGIPFAIGALSLRLQAEFNKPVLARQSYGLAGNFSAAQRAIDMASLPLIALQDALWPRIYSATDPGRRMLSSGAFLILLASLGGLAIWAAAPVLAQILGEGFEASVGALRLLALLPALQLLRNLTNAHSTLRMQTSAIAWSYGIGASAGVLLTLWLVPRHGLQGAVAATYAVEVLTTGGQWLIVLTRRKNRD